MEFAKGENLDKESCKNLASKLTRSTSSLKMGASSHACFQWLLGKGTGSSENGAWTRPTPGTTPDFCPSNKNHIRIPIKLWQTKISSNWQTISNAYILLEKGVIVLWHLQINFQKNIHTNFSNKFYMPIELLLRFHSLYVSLSTISSHFATQVFPICKMHTAVFTGKGKYDQANFPLDQPSLPSSIF